MTPPLWLVDLTWWHPWLLRPFCWSRRKHERWGNGRIDYCLYCGHLLRPYVPADPS